MQKAGQLSIVAPELDAVWNEVEKREMILHPKNLNVLPDWIAEARNNNSLERPVFSYTSQDRGGYAIDVYEDGRVTLDFLWNGIRSTNKETYIKVSPKKVKEFLYRLHEIGFHDWPLSRPSYGKEVTCMDMTLINCSSIDYLVMLNQGDIQHSVFMSQDVYSAPQDNVKFNNISQIFSLVEEYFPTQKLRCTLGTATKFNKDCIAHDKTKMSLAKQGESK